ncbi:hypothetical protein CYPRO_1100 [Cyclonatronum proteinivorum]|uniref:Cytochrome C n=1 Tax=Cyclonatronum proteinivorum TaxID=1457365 RepID=A0A345UIR3_9BACT|nr:hypothetical protein [Cyclonatronum proteinivorum]AXJ00365.1 hypothetical protein CYPRO_1100 [Cyclonatronum proteinivorum]
MMNRCVLCLFLLSLFGTGLLFSCDSAEDEAQSLSELMRERTNQMQALQAVFEAGEIPDTASLSFIPFVQGEPSREALRDPGVIGQMEGFDAFYARFMDHPTPQNYQIVVQSCVSCHERLCPGPLRLIRGLALEEIPEPGLQFFDR